MGFPTYVGNVLRPAAGVKMSSLVMTTGRFFIYKFT